MTPRKKRKIREIAIVTCDRTDHYYEGDGQAVIQAIYDANLNGLARTLPIYLEDGFEEITYTLNNIVKTVISYGPEES